MLIALLAAGLGGWLKLRRRPTSIKEAALDTEGRRADLGCVVSTAAEYISGERPITHQYEPELVAALEEQAASNLKGVEVSYSNRLLAPAAFLAIALLTLLMFAAIAPVAFTAFKRTVAPWSKETYTTVQVMPGSIESLSTGVTSSSPISANRFMPESSSIYRRSTGSSHRATVKPRATARVEASNDAA